MSDPTDPRRPPAGAAEPAPPAAADREPVGEEDEEYEDAPSNPFDNPYFLPVLIGAFALWCGWDGFLSDKFVGRPGTLWFNRIAFLVLGALSAWLGLRARRESAAGEEGSE
jgi:hypothetical protein